MKQQQAMAAPHQPLAGVRVLELAQIMAGPTCGMMLADLGAEVIKIEKFPGGDDARQYQKPGDSVMPPSFRMINRGKRSLAVDIRTPAGKAIIQRLAGQCDVLTENFRIGVMERLGLGYQDIRPFNPGLIYCSITGYGRVGPLASKGGFDCRYQCRHSGGPCHRVRLRASLEDRPGAARRNLVVAGLAATDLLARGELFFERPRDPTPWHGAFVDCALPGVQDAGWWHGDRWRQPQGLDQHLRGAGSPRVECRPPLRPSAKARAEQAGAGDADQPGAGAPRHRHLVQPVRRSGGAGRPAQHGWAGVGARAVAGRGHGGGGARWPGWLQPRYWLPADVQWAF